MDGNGRWAQGRGLLRIKGHEVGSERVEEIIAAAPKYGVKYVTFYAFSKENWQRPKPEVAFLMDLLANYLGGKVRKMYDNNVRFNVIGNTKDLPEKIQAKIVEGMKLTEKCTGLTATFALSYSSRFEITEACRKIAEEAASGKLDPKAITEETVARRLYTSQLPDPDLLIRTSGEMRISNFLLWQISYSELYITDKLWPDFGEEEFAKAIRDYQKRERRFGGVLSSQPSSKDE
jgi:undecaprenyl diphosphate synthase